MTLLPRNSLVIAICALIVAWCVFNLATVAIDYSHVDISRYGNVKGMMISKRVEAGVIPAQSVTFRFNTYDPQTGALAAPDALPTAVLIKNGSNMADSVTVTNLGTGSYKAAFTVPTSGTASAQVTAGDLLECEMSASKSGTSASAIRWRSCVDTKRVSTLNDAPPRSEPPSATANGAATWADNAAANMATTAQAATILAKTNNLPADPASNTQVNTRMASFTYTAPYTPAQNAAAIIQNTAYPIANNSAGEVTANGVSDLPTLDELNDRVTLLYDSIPRPGNTAIPFALDSSGHVYASNMVAAPDNASIATGTAQGAALLSAVELIPTTPSITTADLPAIDASRRVTVGANADKSGYALTAPGASTADLAASEGRIIDAIGDSTVTVDWTTGSTTLIGAMEASSTLLAAFGGASNTAVSTAHGVGSYVATGTGTHTDTYTIANQAGVKVWVTATNNANATPVAGPSYTNTLGVLTFSLDPGTYYFWRYKQGYFDASAPQVVPWGP